MIKILADEINKLKIYQIQTEQKNYEQKIKTNKETIQILQQTINRIENERAKEKQELKQIQTKQKDYEQTIQNLQQTINKIETEKANEKEELNKIKNIIEKDKKDINNKIKETKEQITNMNIIIENNKNNEIIEQIEQIKKEIRKMNTIIENNDKYIQDLKKEQNRLLEEQRIKAELIKKEQEQDIKKLNKQFNEDPCNLKYKEDITNNNSCGGALYNFAVYNGLTDNIEYIVYNNKSNYNLEIMRIIDKTIIISLKGHNNKTTVIRYYIKDNKEEYILSCDENKLIIVWDIQNNYNKKYNIQEKYSGYIYDALLLFNIFNKNYILISSYNNNEYSKVNYMNLKIIHHL